MKWEYLVETIKYTSTHDLEDKLDSFGKDGWESCGILHYIIGEIMIMFKRQKDGN